nr:carboxymuconolactone decarboxylase family protein [Nocardia thailandica]
MRRAVLGDRHVDAAIARTENTESVHLQQFVTEHVWSAIWTRPQLDPRSRSLLTIGILTALRAHDELAAHVRGALTNGLTREEITEAVIHAAGYCGAPAALAAMRIVQQTFDTPFSTVEYRLATTNSESTQHSVGPLERTD